MPLHAHLSERQCLIGAVGDAGRRLQAGAKVAFRCDSAGLRVDPNCAVGTDHDAGPTAYAPVGVMRNEACPFVHVHSS